MIYTLNEVWTLQDIWGQPKIINIYVLTNIKFNTKEVNLVKRNANKRQKDIRVMIWKHDFVILAIG